MKAMQRWFLVAALTAGTVSLGSAVLAQQTTRPATVPPGGGGFHGGIAPSSNPFSQGFPRGAFFPFSGRPAADQVTPGVRPASPNNGVPGQGIPVPPASGPLNPGNPLGVGVSPATTTDPTFGLQPDPTNLANPLGVGTSPGSTLSPNFNFVPGFGFDNGANGFVPGFGFNGSGNGVNPFFFSTNPFFNGFNPFFGGVTNVNPFPGTISGAPMGAVAAVAGGGTRLPVLGLNVPARAVGAPARTRASTSLRSGRTPNGPAVRTSNSTNREQMHVAARLRAVMKTGPMVSGEVVKITDNLVMVKVAPGGEPITRRYGYGEIFFFRGDDLLDATTHPELIVPGLQVMVPDHPSAS